LTFQYAGSCHCNQIELKLHLSQALEHFTAEACDCDFCTDNNMIQLADPVGSLEITSMISIGHSKQGSKQAEFLRCCNCEQIVAVVVLVKGKLHGAINSECLHDADQLGRPKLVLYDALSAEQKMQRWAQSWMPVTLSEPD
jgi:hypothetical protein